MFEGLAKQIKAKETQPAAKPTLPLATVPAPKPRFVGPLPLAVPPVAQKTVTPTVPKKTGLFSGLADSVRAKEAQATATPPAPSVPFAPSAPTVPAPVAAPAAPVEEKGMFRKAAEGVFDFGKRTAAAAGSQIASAAKFGADFVANRPSQVIGAFSPTLPLLIGSVTGQNIDKKVGAGYDKVTEAGLNPFKEAADVTREYSDKVNKPPEEWANLSIGDKITKEPLQTINIMAPQILGSIAPYLLNPAVGFATSVGSTAEDVKRKALENGVPREKAEALGLGTGLAVGVVDKLSFSKIVPPALEQKFVGGLLARLLKAGATEATTESIQENIQIAAESTFRDDLGWDEVKSRNAMAALGGLLGGVGLGGGVDFKENFDEKTSQKPTLPKKKAAAAQISPALPPPPSAPGQVAIQDVAKPPAQPVEVAPIQETAKVSEITTEQAPTTSKDLFKGLADRVKNSNAPTATVDAQTMPIGQTQSPIVTGLPSAPKTEPAPTLPQVKAPIAAQSPAPATTVAPRTELTLTLPQADKRPLEKFDLPDNEKTNEIMAQLAFAEAGKRTAIRNEDSSGMTFTKQESTFPTWIPPKLRRKPLLDAVVKNLSEGTIPTKAAERRLYRVVTDKLKAENSVPNPEKNIDAERQALADPFGDGTTDAQDVAKFDTQKAKERSVRIAAAQNEKNNAAPVAQEAALEPSDLSQASPKTSKVGKSIEAKTIERGLANSFSDTAQYDPITIKDQARRASEIMQTDIEQAKRIVLGEEPLPDGMRAGTMIVAMENYAMENNDPFLLLSIANSPLTAETSIHAQELRLLAERDPDSAVALIQKVKKIKQAAAEKRNVTKSDVVSEIRQKVKKERAASSTKETWASFIDTITC